MDFFHSSARSVANGVEYLYVRGLTTDKGRIAFHVMLRYVIVDDDSNTYVSISESIELLPRNWTT